MNSNIDSTHRFLFIDNLRAFMILLVILEHSLLPYSLHFKKSAYIPDLKGSLFFDICHLCMDAIIISLLLLIAGMFVIPSLKRDEFLKFTQKKLFRLVLPFIIGVTFLVPPQTYARYIVIEDPNIGYLDYLQNIFFFDSLTPSGFWFLYLLFVLTFATVFIYYIIPSVLSFLGKFVTWLTTNPIKGFAHFFMISAVLLGISDLIWGPSRWIGFGKVFYVRGSRFLLEIFFFIIGIGLAEAALNQNKKFLEKLSNSWQKWLLLSLITGTAYMAYSLMYYEEAYDHELIKYFYLGKNWVDIWSVLIYTLPILIRTTFLALFVCSLAPMLWAIFYKFLNNTRSGWQSFAACSFGIYIIHEPVQVWLSYFFYGTKFNGFIKFAITAGLSFFLSWMLVQQVFFNLPKLKNFMKNNQIPLSIE